MIHHTTKYDKSLHYKFITTEIYRNKNTLVLYKPPYTKMNSYRGDFCNDRHLLEIFYNDRYHNIVVMWENDWIPDKLYINIASPATWDDSKISSIDLDLDLFRTYGSDKIVIDDIDEFESHQKKFNYPRDLITTCQNEVKKVESLMIEGNGIFSERCFDWRPGKECSFY